MLFNFNIHVYMIYYYIIFVSTHILLLVCWVFVGFWLDFDGVKTPIA